MTVPAHHAIVPIILAAGPSPHLPFPKALAVFGGKTALQIAVANCAWLARPIVVLGSDVKRIRPAVPENTKVVMNPRWREGQLSSLLAALRHVPARAPFLLYPVDHPLLQKKTIQKLVKAFRARKRSERIVMPRYQGSFGHPVILAAELRKEIVAAKTAREVVYRAPERIKVLNARTSAIYEDFNTLELYRACVKRFEARK